MKVKSLLAVGILAPGLAAAAIAFAPAAHATPTVSCTNGSYSYSNDTVSGLHCSAEPVGTYANAYLFLQGGNWQGVYLCATVQVRAQNVANGTGCVEQD